MRAACTIRNVVTRAIQTIFKVYKTQNYHFNSKVSEFKTLILHSNMNFTSKVILKSDCKKPKINVPVTLCRPPTPPWKSRIIWMDRKILDLKDCDVIYGRPLSNEPATWMQRQRLKRRRCKRLPDDCHSICDDANNVESLSKKF